MLSNIELSNNRYLQQLNQWEFKKHKIFNLMMAFGQLHFFIVREMNATG
jgi:hypothetical protein